jgi:glucokinase
MKACIGIDIGGTNTEIGLVTQAGKVLAHRNLSTRAFENVESFVKELSAIISEIKKTEKAELIGIGIGAPSANYFSGSIEYAPNMPWSGIVPLVKLTEAATSIRTVITNDANAAAIGEQVFGAAKGLRDFMIITLGTGLGSGIVVNNSLVYGHDGFAGELGHVIVDPNGRLCGCGRKGCLETYASATGIVITANELLGSTKSESILNAENISSKIIGEAAGQNDEVAIKAIEFTAEKLGLALANAVAVTSPSHIFLYGGLAKAGDKLFTPLRKYFDAYLLRNYRGKVTIAASSLPDDAAILGAAALAWKEFG